MLILFVDQEREAELDSLGDPLALLDKHVDFAALAGRGWLGLLSLITICRRSTTIC